MDFNFKDLIELVLGFLTGSGISFHFTRRYYLKVIDKSQVQKNGLFSHNNTQIGEMNVRN